MNNKRIGKPPGLPVSAANYAINLLCLSFFFTAIFILHYCFPSIKTIYSTTLALIATVVPLWIFDLFYLGVHRRPSTGLSTQPGQVNQSRLLTKLFGLFGTFAIVLGYYYLIYIYFQGLYLRTFFDFLNFTWPGIIVLCVIYMREIDRRQKNPYDEYWQAGCFLSGQFKKVNKGVLKEYARVWFIKGFFTPYMLAILVRFVETLLALDWAHLTFLAAHTLLLDLFYTVDILYGLLGYILTCRLTDTHIRSTDPTMLGWLVCLMCYGPFNAHFGIGLFDYNDGFFWNHWFAFSPATYYFYAGVILLLSLVYGLATVAFGYRMSNLTYRGIITAGPYRYTKHPAYLGKVGSWWLISLPFFCTGNPVVAVKHTLALGFITFVYFMRAKTEENHLSNYPEYVEYAEWINAHGLFSSLTKRFPMLQYSKEKARRWGSVVNWHDHESAGAKEDEYGL